MKIRLKLVDPSAEFGHRWALVLDDKDQSIGSANDITYHGRKWAVQTYKFAGCYDQDEVEIVNPPTLQ